MANESTQQNDTPERKIILRGADGVLYALSPNDLTPFKLTDEQTEDVTDILEDADKNPVAAKLPNDVVERIQNAGGCVKTSAIPPEVFTNTSASQTDEQS